MNLRMASVSLASLARALSLRQLLISCSGHGDLSFLFVLDLRRDVPLLDTIFLDLRPHGFEFRRVLSPPARDQKPPKIVHGKLKPNVYTSKIENMRKENTFAYKFSTLFCCSGEVIPGTLFL